MLHMVVLDRLRGYGLRLKLRSMHVLLRAALTSHQYPDALQKFYGRTGAFGQKCVRRERSVKGSNRSADDQGWKAGMHSLGASNKLIAVHAGQQQVCDEEIERPGCGVCQNFQRFLRGGGVDNAVAARFQQKCSYGKGLLIVIYTENYFFGSH